MIHLYAEHLLNIRTLSIQACLSTVSNKETKAKLSADGSVLTLDHEGESASVRLPISLSPNRQSNVILTIPAVPSRDLTFRIQLEEKEGVTNGVLSNGAQPESGNVVPWTANSLSGETEVRCKSCEAILVERGTVGDWKDLPSEGWAEMMDFWHCHKPNEAHQPEHGALKKGYAADRHVALEEGVGMVDAASFLLHRENCQNIMAKKLSDSDTAPALLLCAVCKVDLGQVDTVTQGFKLWKLNVSVSEGLERSPTSFEAEKWLACSLLNAVDNQGVRKLIVSEYGSASSDQLKLWIFTPDLSISSSIKSSVEYIRVAKVLWQECTKSEDVANRLNSSSLSEGEFVLGHGQVDLLRQIMKESSSVLPENAKDFQDWHIGLLERFTLADLDCS